MLKHWQLAESYSVPTEKELFNKLLNDWKLLTSFAKITASGFEHKKQKCDKIKMLEILIRSYHGGT